jgi:hypothetical protein
MISRLFRLYLQISFLVFIPLISVSQHIDTSAFKLNTRLSFYTLENDAEFLLHVPLSLQYRKLSVSLSLNDKTIASWDELQGKTVQRLPFPLGIMPSVYDASVRITEANHPGIEYSATSKLIILPYKPNEVKSDRLTGGMIVNRRQFFPFGFYCYSPVNPGLPEEEITRGFNMMSPYQKIVPETINDRKAYMDRCAELGMKVHYNLLSLSAGGGVGSKIEDLSDTERRARLITEIKTFMDHPALLGWYISDEPNGTDISPQQLEEVYRVVKQNDPWHPVSIVFMVPFLESRNYINALDIVMADPYPVPNRSITITGDIAGQLKTEFHGKRSVWMVLQTFGGGEWWGREPTIQEIRSMTWQSIIKGAAGIQYFVRQGLNYFPKSVATWSECGRMAMEVAELTPWLLSDETALTVESSDRNVLVTSRLYNGQLAIMAVNTRNEPVSATIRVNGINNGIARVMFENRSVTFTNGVIINHLSSFGSQVYMIDLNQERKSSGAVVTNLIKDPGFEDFASPGIPSACYARPGGDRGATYFLDSREHYEGNHSLRLVTPAENKSVSIRLFPISVRAGASYSISIWAKSDPEQRFLLHNHYGDRLSNTNVMPQYAEVSMGELVRARFSPDSQWRQFVTFVTIPADTLATFKINLILKMPGQGVGWFDQVKVTEDK